MIFKTDLNEQDRIDFARRLKAVGSQINALVDALELEDDTNLAVELVLLSFQLEVVNELGRVIRGAAQRFKAVSKEPING